MGGAGGREAVELAFTYTEDEYIDAARFFYTRGADTGFMLYLGLAVLACALLFAWLGGDPYLAGLALFVGAALLAWRRYAHSTLPRMHFRRNPKFREPYELTFADGGILFRSRGMESRLEWGFYAKALETPDYFFLVYGKDMFSLIPKRVLRDRRQEAALREMMRRKLVGGVETFGLPAGEAIEAARDYAPPPEPPDWR